MDGKGLADWLEDGAQCARHACIGMDGFADRVLRVVDSRMDSSHVTYIPTLREYGERLCGASGRSLNIELMQTSVKLGGNGPIMAYAMARLGGSVTCWGTLGYPTLSQVFEPLGEIAELRSIGEPGSTDAYEFDDGKIIASALEPLNALSWSSIIEHIGRDELSAMLDAADLIALNNWTMIPCMTDVWQKLCAEVLPGLAWKNRLFFVDLADPAKRTTEDIRAALEALSGFAAYGSVLLSCNYSEAAQLAAALGLGTDAMPPEALCRDLREQTGIDFVSIHTRSGAYICGSTGISCSEGYFTDKPFISVGGGDHFNAGLAFGLLERLTAECSLRLGNAVSGFYVRTGVSPDRAQLAGFIRAMENSGA